MKKTSQKSENYYHNTKILLKKYRTILVGMEMASQDIKYHLIENTGIDLLWMETLAELLDLDLSNHKLESRILSMEKNRKMIAIINHALSLMREYENKGEAYYYILYYKYFCKNIDKPNSIFTLSQKLAEHGIYLGEATIKNYQKQAIQSYSDILWGYTSIETEALLLEFLDK